MPTSSADPNELPKLKPGELLGIYAQAWVEVARRQATTQRFFDMQSKAAQGHAMAQSILGRFWSEVFKLKLKEY